MKKGLGDVIGATVCALFGVGVWVATDRNVMGDGMGLFHADARLFPHFIAFMITLISVLWLGRAVVLYRAADGAAPGTGGGAGERREEWSGRVRVVLFVVLFLAYIQLIRPLGFAVASMAAGLGALAILKERRPLIYIITAACAFLIHAVFVYLLKVRLP